MIAVNVGDRVTLAMYDIRGYAGDVTGPVTELRHSRKDGRLTGVTVDLTELGYGHVCPSIDKVTVAS